MSTTERPSSRRRLVRTLPWLAGLLLGTSAHIVWWTSTRAPGQVVHVVNVPSPSVHVKVHRAHGDGSVHVKPQRSAKAQRSARAMAHADAGSCHRSDRSAKRRAPAAARGAVVCSTHGCTIRRSFVERMLRDPSLLGPLTDVRSVHGPAGPEGLRVLGVYPGSVADLVGLRSGDVITAIDGVPMKQPSDLTALGRKLAEPHAIALTLQRGTLRQTLRYRVIDG